MVRSTRPARPPSRPTPAIGVAAVVLDQQEQVLLIRRGTAPAAGLWSIPGGRLEPGENLVSACRREVLEETGIAIDPGPIIAVAERAMPGFHYVIIDFLAMLPDTPAPRAGGDVTDARWIEYELMHRWPLVERLADIVERARQLDHFDGLVDAAGRQTDFVVAPGNRPIVPMQ